MAPDTAPTADEDIPVVQPLDDDDDEGLEEIPIIDPIDDEADDAGSAPAPATPAPQAPATPAPRVIEASKPTGMEKSGVSKSSSGAARSAVRAAETGDDGKERVGVSPEDVLLARAVLQRGLAPRQRVESCLAEMIRLKREGGSIALGRIFVARGVIGSEQCGKLLDAIRTRLELARALGQPMVLGDSAAGSKAGEAAAPTNIPATVKPLASDITVVEPDADESNVVIAEVVPSAVVTTPDGPHISLEESRIADAQDAAGWEVLKSTEAERAVAESVEAAAIVPEASPAETREIAQAAATVEAEPDSEKTQTDILDFSDDDEEDDPVMRTGLLKAFDLKSISQFEFGPYQVIDELAQGAMGVIYRAKEIATDRVVALKCMHNADTSEPELKRFIAEAMSAQKLDHTGVVKVLDFGVVEDVPYLTMEFLEGTPLSAIMESELMDRRQLVEILASVCEAAGYAHQHGVTHRDLKPPNVIVCKDRPVITDFGLAKDRGKDFDITHDGAKVGTPFFLSPEQVHGDKDVDGRADIWALGVILYQMLTNRLPHTGRSLYRLYRHIDTQAPTAPTDIAPDCPEALERICLKALVKKREERYAKAEDMATDLRRWLDGDEVKVYLPGEKRPDPVKAKTSHEEPAAVVVASAGEATPPRGIGRDILLVLITLAIVGGAVAAYTFLPLTSP